MNCLYNNIRLQHALKRYIVIKHQLPPNIKIITRLKSCVKMSNNPNKTYDFFTRKYNGINSFEEYLDSYSRIIHLYKCCDEKLLLIPKENWPNELSRKIERFIWFISKPNPMCYLKSVNIMLVNILDELTYCPSVESSTKRKRYKVETIDGFIKRKRTWSPKLYQTCSPVLQDWLVFLMCLFNRLNKIINARISKNIKIMLIQYYVKK